VVSAAIRRNLHRMRDGHRTRWLVAAADPMSEVAGRMSVQVGACCLQKAHGDRGILLGGVPGVAPARVVVLGGGVAGTNDLPAFFGAARQAG